MSELREALRFNEMKQIKEKLDGMLAQYGVMTVKELLTSTGSIALPAMVQAQALLVMKSKIDLREYAASRVRIPKGAGKTCDIQVLTAPDYGSWTEGSALSAADPTVAKATATLVPFGKVTQISDLLQNTSAINFVENVGRIHGGCVIQGILDKVIDAVAASTAHVTSIGTKADSTEADFTMTNLSTVISAVLTSGFTPNILNTAPDKLWAAIVADYAKYVFYGALADFVISGKAPLILGMKTLADPYFELAINAGSAWNGTDGEKYAEIMTQEFSYGWAELQPDPDVEIYRVPTELANYVVTHLDGGAALTVTNSVGIIKHAA